MTAITSCVILDTGLAVNGLEVRFRLNEKCSKEVQSSPWHRGCCLLCDKCLLGGSRGYRREQDSCRLYLGVLSLVRDQGADRQWSYVAVTWENGLWEGRGGA